MLSLRTKNNDELFRLWRAELAFRYRSDRSLKEAERVMGKFETFLGGYPPSAEVAKSYLSQFRGRKPNTIARYTILVGQFMRWYGEPLDIKIRQPKMLPQTTQPEDVAKIRDAMASRKSHKKKAQRDILLVDTARLTGLRRAELANLKIGQLDFANQVVVVRSGKGLKDRSVPLAQSLSAKLEAFCRGREPDESLFGLKAVTISGKISSWAKKAGCPQIHAHSLRHQFGTELARKNVGARMIQSLLGHSDLSVTQLYVDVVGRDLRGAIDLLEEPTPESVPPTEEVPPLGELVDLLHRWREQAQFCSLDQVLRQFYLEGLGEKLRHCTSETQCEAKIYDTAKRHHVQTDLRPGRVLVPVEEEVLFRRLRQRYPADAIWETQDSWGRAYAAYLDAFSSLCGDIDYDFASCLALSSIDELPQQDRGVADTKDFIELLKKKDANWVVFLELVSLVVCCDLLTLGIAELPPNPLWFFQVDKLKILRDDAIKLITSLPGDFSLMRNEIGAIAGPFWERLAQVKENTIELLHKLQTLQAAHDDLHNKLTALESRLYDVTESQPP